MKGQEQRSLTLRSTAADLNNVAICFYEQNNMRLATATYDEALQALREHTNFLGAQSQGEIAALRRWREKLTERESLVRCIRNNENKVQPDLTCPFFGSVKPIALTSSLSSEDHGVSSIILYNKGLALFQLGQLDRALGCLEMASELTSNAYEHSPEWVKPFLLIRCLLGIVYTYQGRFSESVMEFTTVQRIREDFTTDDCNDARTRLLNWLDDAFVPSEGENETNDVVLSDLSVVRSDEQHSLLNDENHASPAA